MLRGEGARPRSHRAWHPLLGPHFRALPHPCHCFQDSSGHHQAAPKSTLAGPLGWSHLTALPAWAWVTGMSRRDYGCVGWMASAVTRRYACTARGRSSRRDGQVEGRRGGRKRGAEAGGSPWFCGWTRSSAHVESCRAPWTPHTGTLPGPHCHSCRRSRCSPAEGAEWGQKGDRSGWGEVGMGEADINTYQDTNLYADLAVPFRPIPGLPEDTSGLNIRVFPPTP